MRLASREDPFVQFVENRFALSTDLTEEACDAEASHPVGFYEGGARYTDRGRLLLSSGVSELTLLAVPPEKNLDLG